MEQCPTIVFEDNLLLVIDKPAGMPAVSLTKGEQGTLAAWILGHYAAQAHIERGTLEAGLCHRLDNDTSGIMVAARTSEAYESLRRQFNAAEVRKEYIALVIGAAPEKDFIDAPIAHHPRKKTKMVVCNSEAQAKEWKARPAITRFKTIARYALSPHGRRRAPAQYTLLSVSIDTGVRHQIRVHLAHIGHPLAGDKLYRNPSKRVADPLLLDRHFLHCTKLAFRHPATGRIVSFESPLPQDLNEALSRLRIHI